MTYHRFSLAICLLLFILSGIPRLDAEEKAPTPRLRPAGIDGAVLILGDKVPDAVRERFVRLAGGEKAKLVLVSIDDKAKKQRQSWEARKPASAIALSLSSREAAIDPDFLKPLRQATGVWFEGEISPSRALEKELLAVLKRGGIAAGTALLCRRLPDGKEEPRQRRIHLLPGTVIAPLFDANRKARLLSFMAKHPKMVGVGMSAEAALLVKGREMRVLGRGSVTVCLAACLWRPARIVELRAGSQSDFTMWRRAALARGEAACPAAKAAVPEVPRGSLVIVGGGAMPPSILRKFIDLAGGPDVPIVVLPTAQPDPIPARFGESTLFEKAGAKNVHILPKRGLKDVEDPKNLEWLRKAKGVWFGGGRQWRFVDAYEGTKAEPLFGDVLRRGGVLGGSSAGASIQAEYLVRGSPLNNTDMMCEGYERGLGFLPGVAVDQHFAARRRFADMTGLMKTYPQLLGIGIDESTALVVQGHVGEILGRGKVYFYDRRKPFAKDGPDYEAIKRGGRYDLKERKVLP
ncbi:MAG: Type 1 glutamine amidotransferase-like domain-containing protein [Gemmataceae bacterium]